MFNLLLIGNTGLKRAPGRATSPRKWSCPQSLCLGILVHGPIQDEVGFLIDYCIAVSDQPAHRISPKPQVGWPG